MSAPSRVEPQNSVSAKGHGRGGVSRLCWRHTLHARVRVGGQAAWYGPVRGCIRRGGAGGGGGGLKAGGRRGVWLGLLFSFGPPMVPAEGGPKILSVNPLRMYYRRGPMAEVLVVRGVIVLLGLRRLGCWSRRYVLELEGSRHCVRAC